MSPMVSSLILFFLTVPSSLILQKPMRKQQTDNEELEQQAVAPRRSSEILGRLLNAGS
jgi:hypothetical protein